MALVPETASDSLIHKLSESEADAFARPRHMKALIDGDLGAAELERRLKLGGLECYPDCAGNTFIRTVEAGDRHREVVRAERQARLDHARRHNELVRQEVAERLRPIPTDHFEPTDYGRPEPEDDVDFDDGLEQHNGEQR